MWRDERYGTKVRAKFAARGRSEGGRGDEGGWRRKEGGSRFGRGLGVDGGKVWLWRGEGSTMVKGAL